MATYEIEKIRDNVKQIEQKIAVAAEKSGRKRQDIIFCAASKTQEASVLAHCSAMSGLDVFGENRVQELRDKMAQEAYGTKPIHFIGRLQSNKVKDVVGKVALIHSVDSVARLQEIDRRAVKLGVVQSVLVQINIGDEASKGGIGEGVLPDFLAMCPQYSGIQVCGLMAIPPNMPDGGENRKNFQRLRQLFVDSAGKKYDNVSMDILSMGMSGDFEEAILCGSTLVRIGSALFGSRDI